MPALMRYLLAMIFMGLAVPKGAAEKRVALVIGNAGYKHTAPLKNPMNDAADIAAVLRKLRFQVLEGQDLDKAGMDRTIWQFARALAGADVGLFFYAGHGLQVGGANYLVPVDAKLEDASGLDFEMVRLDLVQKTMERETRTNVVSLDACRDNPLARNLARAMGTRSGPIGRGLAAVESGVGTLISFSTQPGNVALDGVGRNSPYAGALVKRLGDPKDDLSSLLIQVRNDVMAATQDRQVPWEHSALRARLYFDAPPEQTKSEAQPSAPTFEQQAELAFWNAVKDSANPAVIQTYVDAYPKGSFASLARALVEHLKRNEEQKITLALREAALRKADEAKQAAEALEAEAARKAAGVQQAEELKRAQAEAQRAREALARAEKDRAAALKAAEQEREAARKSAAEPARLQEEAKGKAADAASQQTKVAALPAPDAPKTAGSNLEVLARDLQRELKRVGCDPGPIDGRWGGKAKEALREFAKRMNVALATDDPTAAALEALNSRKDRVCALTCRSGHIEVDGACQSKPGDQIATPNSAEKKSADDSTASKRPDSPRGYGGTCTKWMFHNSSCIDAAGRRCTQQYSGRVCD